MPMRLPVTSSRRCEQMTAFGASEVPRREDQRPERVDVGLEPGVVGARPRRERRSEARLRSTVTSTGVDELGSPRSASSSVEVPRLGDDETAVGVHRRRAAGARRGGCG